MKAQFLLAVSVTGLLACGVVAPAQAQSTATRSTVGADDAASSEGLADIVVTAQRKVESAQKAALAIDVIAPSQLISAGVTSVTTLSRTAPSLAVAQAGGPNVSLFVRGVGNFTFNGFTDPAVDGGVKCPRSDI